MMEIAVTSEALADICSKIDASRRFAIDLEFIPERTYQPVLCLVQLAIGQEAYLIDPLAVTDLMSLWQRVSDPQIETVLHAAVQDLDLIYKSSLLVPHNIFDTQIAAGFAGFGFPMGYGKLLHQLLGISIAKTESFSDWLERPLTDSQINYAVEDVCHLLPMADRLTEILKKQGRDEWVLEECEQFCRHDYYARGQKEEFTRVKGASGLNRRGLAVLQSLCELRVELAVQLNRPTKSVLSDNTLIELSRRPPKQIQDIQRIRGIRSDQVRSFGQYALNAVEKALRLSDNDLPSWPSGKITPKREVVIGDMLYSVLKVIAYEADIATELVATRDEVQTLVRQARENELKTSHLALMHGWRYAMAGATLADLLSDTVMAARFQLHNDPPVVLDFSVAAARDSQSPKAVLRGHFETFPELSSEPTE